MAGEWALHRLRSAFIRENSLLIVLRLLREDAELGEWEILTLLHSRYGSTPTTREFRRLCELMVSGGYADLDVVGTTRKLRITETGAKLLQCLEEEYQAIVSRVSSSSGAVLTR